MRQSPLGSLGTDGSWLWAWANHGTHPVGSRRRALSLRLRDFGEAHEVYEFVEPLLALRTFPAAVAAAERLALTAMSVLGARGYGSLETETGARAYFLVDGEAVPRAPFRREVLSSLFLDALGLFPPSLGSWRRGISGTTDSRSGRTARAVCARVVSATRSPYASTTRTA